MKRERLTQIVLVIVGLFNLALELSMSRMISVPVDRRMANALFREVPEDDEEDEDEGEGYSE